MSNVCLCVAAGSSTNHHSLIVASTAAKQSAPIFEQPLRNTTVQRGEEILLSTQVSGQLRPALEWNKDGLKILPAQPRINQYADSQGNATLTVSRGEVGDSGEYSCQAENSLGRDFTHCRVSVITAKSRDGKESLKEGPALTITRPLADLTLHEGHRGTLECECRASVKPQVEWYHDNRLVAVSRTLRTYFDGRLAMLKIFEADSREHNGKYECRFVVGDEVATSQATIAVEGMFNHFLIKHRH